MEQRKLESAFEQELLQLLDRAQRERGISGGRLPQEIQKYGGLEAVRRRIKRGQASDSFALLREQGALELSPEALVTKSGYGMLFTDEEVNFCLELLCEAGFFHG